MYVRPNRIVGGSLQQTWRSSRIFTGTSTVRFFGSRYEMPLSRSLADIIPSGIMAVYKPVGWTSQDVVSRIKSILSHGVMSDPNNYSLLKNSKGELKRPKVKIGHGGTLDPAASGVLVIGVGSGTKEMKKYLEGSKRYLAQGRAGWETDTQDKTGSATLYATPNKSETSPTSISTIKRAKILQILDQFRGNITQIPPMYSALKVDGKRLYDLARQGIEIPREPRGLTIFDIQLTGGSIGNESYDAHDSALNSSLVKANADFLSSDSSVPETFGNETTVSKHKYGNTHTRSSGTVQNGKDSDVEYEYFNIDVTCSGGTYVRTLIEDIARACGSRAHLASLQRLKGMFAVITSVDLLTMICIYTMLLCDKSFNMLLCMH